jgi:carbon monoxide dehydrogenase subunit G
VRLELSGTQEIAAPAATVWQCILDHEFIAAAAPGVESAERIDPEHFRVIASLGVGSIRLRFALQVELVDVQPPSHLRMSVKGSAPGSAMRAEAGALIASAGPRASTVEWTIASDVHGNIASTGARLLQGTARKLTVEFWENFATRASEKVEESGGSPKSSESA